MGPQVALTKGALSPSKPSSLSQKGQSPKFSARGYCDQTAAWIKMLLATMVGLGPGKIALDADPAPPWGTMPQVWAHDYCGQTAAWIKMALGMEVGFGGHIVLDGYPVPPTKRGTAPNFRPTCIVAKRLDGQDATWHEGRPQPRRVCVRWRPIPVSYTHLTLPTILRV